MQTLQDAYRQTLPMAIEALEFAARQISSNSQDAIESVRKQAHQLRGSGASFGFPAISEAATELELASDEDLDAKCRQLIDVLRQVTMSQVDEGSLAVVVTNDADTAQQLSVWLMDAGWHVQQYTSRAEVLGALSVSTPRLVLLDMILSDGDGRSLLAELDRQSGGTIPVVMMGAGIASHIREECIRLGAEAFWEKPLDEHRLISLIDHLASHQTESADTSTDPLTGLPNQQSLRTSFNTLHAIARRQSKITISVAVVDIDHMTEINSKFGHVKGDEVIREVGLYLRNRLRASDTFGRWSGDRFLLILADTEERQASEFLNGVLEELNSQLKIPGISDSYNLTFSAGVAQIEQGIGFEEVFELAETRAFRAKSAGRSRVICSIADKALDQLRVLIADDDEMIVRLIAHRLEREGFEVLHAANGKEALDVVKSESDLKMLILDVKMPMRDGFDVLREVRSIPKFRETPILMLTSMGSERDLIRGFELGATDYLTKPFSPRELTARILHHLKRLV